MFALLHKWLGVRWDSLLTFDHNFQVRTGAARAAFKEIAAVARAGLAPLAELRETVRGKVLGTLFFAAPFLFLAAGAVEMLDDLQIEFERTLIGATKHHPAREAIRAEMAAPLTWGEELILVVLGVRAELWALPEDLYVKRVWRAAPSLKGRTLARETRALLDELKLPEVFELPGWSGAGDNPEAVVTSYKQRIRMELEARSAESWRTKLARGDAAQVHLYACPAPVSAAATFLGEDDMEAVWAADHWGAVRIGLIQVTQGGARTGKCALCGAPNGGLAHVARSCSQLREARARYWTEVTAARRQQLLAGGEGTWALAAFSVVADLQDLRAGVMFGDAVAKAVQGTKAS